MSTRFQGFLCLALAIGCTGEHDSPEETVMSESAAADDTFRIFAECYILREIEELDAEARSRLMNACRGAPYRNADEALDDFGGSQSVTVAQVEWIRSTWRDRKTENPGIDSSAFAAEVAGEVFADVEF